MKKCITLMGSFLLVMALTFTGIQAQEADGSIGLTFEGNSGEFITYEQENAYEEIMPGEERIQKVVLTNNDYREMKFFVRADYVTPLGEGTTSGEIAYDISFANNNESFFEGKIGGVTKANMNSLENNYLLKTLKQGESTTIELNIKVDGDSMTNEYQGSEGVMNLVFSVEYDENTPVENVVQVVKKIPVINKIPGVSTGDTTAIGLLLGVTGASLVAIMILIVMKMKKRKEDGNETR